MSKEEDIDLKPIEIERLIRLARMVRDDMIDRKMQLQDRLLFHGNGHTREAILQLENEIFLLSQAIGKLWAKMSPRAREGLPPPLPLPPRKP